MGKYDGNLIEMLVKTDNPRISGKSAVHMFGKDVFAAAPNWVEIMTVTGDFKMMEGTPVSTEKIVHIGPDGHKGGPYPKRIANADKLMFFYGTDTTNPEDLGADVEVYIGENDDMEMLKFSSPRCVFVPRGLRHGPVFVKNFRHNLIIFSILTAQSREEAQIVTDFSYVSDDNL